MAAKKPVRKKASPEVLAALPKTKPRGKGRAKAKEADEAVDTWHRAWFLLDVAGLSQRDAGDAIGVSAPTAVKYAGKWRELMGGSVVASEERDRQLMVLGELEQRLVREGLSGRKSWAELTGPLRGVLADRRELTGIASQKGKQVTVEVGAAAGVEGSGGMPAALAGVVAKVTISDNEEEAA